MKKKGYKFIAWLMIIGIFNFITVSRSVAFTIGEERELGEKLLFSVRSSFQLLDDPDIVEYINSLGENVLEVAGVQYFDYNFFVIKNKEFNAFAAPSGLIFFHSGLIGTMNSEDELISVMAHEIGHIVKRHLASRMEKGKYSSLASLGLAIAAIAFGGAATPALLAGALATGQSINLHFSRLHEEEADLLAFEWMKKLNRNPQGQVEMLKSMRRIARYRSDQLPQYLLTHPNPEARLDYIESLVEIEKVQLSRQPVENDDFEFMRFKYRILSQIKDTSLFKASLASVIADKRSSEFVKIMAYYGLSQISKNENDYALSLDLLQKVINYFPDKPILMVDKGVIDFEAGRYWQAKSILKEALQTDSSDMYATFALARLLYRMGDISGAEKYLKRVTLALPTYAKPYYQLGQIEADKDQPGQSSYYLGKYYLYVGKLKLAKMSFNEALRVKGTPEATRDECKELLTKIENLQK